VFFFHAETTEQKEKWIGVISKSNWFAKFNSF
jgi:hypothetical protein